MEAGTAERTGAEVPPPDFDPESDAEAIAASNGRPDTDAEPDADLEGEGNDEQAIPELVVEGDGQLTLKVGGRKPDKSTVKLRGGSISIPRGQFEKGDTVNLLVKVTCSEVHLVDKRDNTTGEVVETERRQIMKITGVERVGG